MQRVIVGLVAAAFGASAHAADIYTPGSFKDSAITAPSWAGFYIGIHGGATRSDYEDGNVRVSAERGFDGSAFSFDGLDAESWEAIGGLHAGYNWQWSQLVFGVEGAASLGEDAIDYIGSLRGRLGWAFGSVHLYGTGGVSFGGFADDFAVTSDGGVGLASRERSNEDNIGWVAGGGAELKLTQSVSLGVEGLYHRFQDYNSKIVLEDDDGDTATFTTDAEQDFWVLRARLSYHFAVDGDAPLK